MINNYLIQHPRFQYPIYRLNAFKKSLLQIFSPLNISYTKNVPFLFIVGSGRSGNTLLRRLLMEYMDIYIPPESYVLSSEVITHLNTKSLNWNDKVDLTLAKIEYYPEFSTFEIDSLRSFAIHAKKFEKSKRNIGALIYELYKWIAQEKGYKVVWVGDKTPYNTLNLGLIKKLFPKASYIYIQRDGVDVCKSYIKTKTYNDINDAADRWNNSIIAWYNFRKLLPTSNYIEIKYEDLVKTPNIIINSIIEKFKITKNVERKDVVSDMGDVIIRNHHNNVTNPPSISSIGKGRQKLTSDERKILQKKINKYLVELGYEQI